MPAHRQQLNSLGRHAGPSLPNPPCMPQDFCISVLHVDCPLPDHGHESRDVTPPHPTHHFCPRPLQEVPSPLHLSQAPFPPDLLSALPLQEPVTVPASPSCGKCKGWAWPELQEDSASSSLLEIGRGSSQAWSSCLSQGGAIRQSLLEQS